MGLVRISTDQYIGKIFKILTKNWSKIKVFIFLIEHLIEFQVKVRFLFIFLGPKKSNIDYYEIGRCMGTLMTNKVSFCFIKIKKSKEKLVYLTCDRSFTNALTMPRQDSS